MVELSTPQKDNGNSTGTSEKTIVSIPTAISIISLLVSAWVGLSYWNLRQDYVVLKTDYALRKETVDTLAKQSVALTEQLSAAQTPKLKVINFLEAATSLPGVDLNTEKGVEQSFRRMKQLADQYAAQGYVLLDADLVISAPKAMQLSIEELNDQ